MSSDSSQYSMPSTQPQNSHNSLDSKQSQIPVDSDSKQPKQPEKLLKELKSNSLDSRRLSQFKQSHNAPQDKKSNTLDSKQLRPSPQSHNSPQDKSNTLDSIKSRQSQKAYYSHEEIKSSDSKQSSESHNSFELPQKSYSSLGSEQSSESFMFIEPQQPHNSLDSKKSSESENSFVFVQSQKSSPDSKKSSESKNSESSYDFVFATADTKVSYPKDSSRSYDESHYSGHLSLTDKPSKIPGVQMRKIQSETKLQIANGFSVTRGGDSKLKVSKKSSTLSTIGYIFATLLVASLIIPTGLLVKNSYSRPVGIATVNIISPCSYMTLNSEIMQLNIELSFVSFMEQDWIHYNSPTLDNVYLGSVVEEVGKHGYGMYLIQTEGLQSKKVDVYVVEHKEILDERPNFAVDGTIECKYYL